MVVHSNSRQISFDWVSWVAVFLGVILFCMAIHFSNLPLSRQNEFAVSVTRGFLGIGPTFIAMGIYRGTNQKIFWLMTLLFALWFAINLAIAVFFQ